MNRHHIMSFVVLLITVALTACHGGNGPDVEAERANVEANLETHTVSLFAVEAREEHPKVSLVGEIRAFDTVTIVSEVSGRLEAVLVEVGDRVVAGQTLVRIDRDTYRLRLDAAEADLAAAQADLELAGRELERKRDLRSDNTIPQAALDQAQATYDLAAARHAAATAAVALARTEFERSEVKAPADGTVTARMAVPGGWTDVGMGLVKMALGTNVKVAARVPSHWVPYLRDLEGFDFTVRPDEPSRHAKLYSVDPVVNESSRSFEVVGTASATGLKPGLFANITLTSPEAVTSLWVPVKAVVASDTPRVLLAVDGVAEPRAVQVGRRDDGMVEVTTGLSAGEHVIADVAGLSRGLPVEVIE